MSHPHVGPRVGDVARHGYGDGSYGTGTYSGFDPVIVPITVTSRVRELPLTMSVEKPRLVLSVASFPLSVRAFSPVLTLLVDEAL